MEVTKSDILKKQLLLAMEKNMAIVTHACKKAGCSRKTFYEYYNNDPDFKEQIDALQDMVVDFAEGALLKSIQNGSDTAIIFYLKCKGKKRGYIERSELDLLGVKIGIEMDGDKPFYKE